MKRGNRAITTSCRAIPFPRRTWMGLFEGWLQLLEFLLHFFPSGACRLGGQGRRQIYRSWVFLPQVWGDLEFIFR